MRGVLSLRRLLPEALSWISAMVFISHKDR
jgi:hypothetical protein